jgi:AraC-like DNA-binding protein
VNAAGLNVLAAPDSLRPFVRRYLYGNHPLDAPVIYRPKPTGYTYLSHAFGRTGGYSIVIDGMRSKRDERRYLLGQIVDHEIAFICAEQVQFVVCELTPTAHQRLFRLSGAAIFGAKLPLAYLAPRQEAIARSYFRLGPEADVSEHIAGANAFFERLAEEAAPADQLVEGAVTMFEAADGAIQVSEIARRLGVSPRELGRRFLRNVGVSPKFFGQVLQINRAIDLLYGGRASSFAEVAAEAGFFDQSHLNRAMRRFFREAPSTFLKSEHYALETFGAGSRRPEAAPGTLA